MFWGLLRRKFLATPIPSPNIFKIIVHYKANCAFYDFVFFKSDQFGPLRMIDTVCSQNFADAFYYLPRLALTVWRKTKRECAGVAVLT